jgi:hypothetical protein
MLVLVKEVVGAIAVAKIVELPRLGCCEPAANHILIDEDFNGTEVASKIARIGIGLCSLPTPSFLGYRTHRRMGMVHPFTETE